MNRAERRQLRREGLVCEHGHVKKTDGTGTPMCPHWCGFEHLRQPAWPSLAQALDQHPDVTHNPYENPRMYGDPACGCGWHQVDATGRGEHWHDHFATVWRELRTVRTAEQLATLPVGVVVRELEHPVPGIFTLEDTTDDLDGAEGCWYVIGDGRPTDPTLPVLLLDHPEWAQA